MKGVIKFLIFIAVIAGAWWGWTYWESSKELEVKYTDAAVTRDNVLITIDATGVVKPEKTVDVGAQVSGQIVAFGTDTEGKEVDYASHVKKGQVLARIDDVLILSDISRAKAGVAEAKASIERNKAEILQNQAKYNQAKRNRDRAEKLGPGEALARITYDQYIAEEESAQAALAAAKASLAQSEASLLSAQASLEKEQRNLDYTVITSPVDGEVVTRSVDVGNTVVSSMNAPSLFLIAKDLQNVQVWAAVNEADIGRIFRGQKVVFTVNAFPDREFEGTVNKIRLNATMTSNVVTYVVEIDAPNPDRVLLPYLTADVKFIVHDLKNTLVVPNAATRFVPDDDMIVAADFESYLRKEEEYQGEQYKRRGEKRIALWVQDGNYVRPVWVDTGESNGSVTPVKPVEEGALKENMKVVTSANRLSDPVKVDASGGSKNPFMPNMPRRNKRTGGGSPPPRR